MLITILLFIKLISALAACGILIFVAFIMFSFRDMVPFVPTPRKMLKKIISMADIKDNERVVDLGSGSGRIIMAVAKKYKKNLIIGVEKSYSLRLATKFFLFFHPFLKKRVQVINKDFFNLDLTEFDVIFCFLTPEALRILLPKFQLLKPGSRIVSYMFALENSQGFEENIEYATSKDSIYLYKKI